MLVAIYIVLAVLILIYQMCFMFKPMFYKVEQIGNFCFFISLLLIIPVIIIGGWKKIFLYLGISVAAYIVGLIIAAIVWRAVNKKFINNGQED